MEKETFKKILLYVTIIALIIGIILYIFEYAIPYKKYEAFKTKAIKKMKTEIITVNYPALKDGASIFYDLKNTFLMVYQIAETKHYKTALVCTIDLLQTLYIILKSLLYLSV